MDEKYLWNKKERLIVMRLLLFSEILGAQASQWKRIYYHNISKAGI